MGEFKPGDSRHLVNMKRRRAAGQLDEGPGEFSIKDVVAQANHDLANNTELSTPGFVCTCSANKPPGMAHFVSCPKSYTG